jgi:hypothetical protein
MIEVKGKCGISVKVIADSIAVNGKRMTTFELEYPRLFHSEFMTHRVLSKNASSSRAVPLKKAIEQVADNPAFPVHWGKNQPGMMAREELSGIELSVAKELWQEGIDFVVDLVGRFDEIGAHKQFAARPLEPFQMIKVVVSGTDWDNMLWLRDDEEAQPEFGELAAILQMSFNQSIPVELKLGEWHLPYIDSYRDSISDILHYADAGGLPLTPEDAKKISASCCAQISYRRLNDSKEKALEIYGKLFSGRKPHLSPTEHQATPIDYNMYDKNVPFNPNTWEDGITHVTIKGDLHSGNLNGWIQYRQTLPNNVFVK